MKMGRGRPIDHDIAHRGESNMGGWFTSGCEEEPDEDNCWNDDEYGDVPGGDDDDD